MLRLFAIGVILLHIFVPPLPAQQDTTAHFDYDLAVRAAYDLARGGKYEDARLLCKRVLRDKPGYVDARLLLGNTYAWTGNYEEARRVYYQVFDYDNVNKAAMLSLADVEIWSGHPAAAMNVCESALVYYPYDKEIWLKYAKASMQTGDLLTAKKSIFMVLHQDPTNEAARKLYQQIRDGIPYQPVSTSGAFSNTYEVVNVDTLMKYARRNALNEQYGTTRNLTRQILQQRPNYIPAILLNVYTYAWGNDFVHARRELNRLDAIGTRNKDVINAWIDIEKWARNYDQAIDYCKVGRKLFPDDESYLVKMSEVYALKGDYVQAKRILYNQIIKGKYSAELFNAYTLLMNSSSREVKIRRNREIADSLFRAMKADSLIQEARQFATVDKNYPRALGLIERVLSVEPTFYDALFLKGSILAWQHHYDEAISIYKSLFKESFDSYELIASMVDVYTWSKRYNEAMDMVSYGLTLFPGDPELLYKKAVIYQATGNLDLANSELNNLLKSNPSDKRIRDAYYALKGPLSVTGISGAYTFNQYKLPFKRTWQMYTMRYYHSNDSGTYIGSAHIGFVGNDTARIAQGPGVQFEVDAYPVFPKQKRYFHFNYGFSPSQVFARHRFGAHLYNEVAAGWELSGGLNYMFFRDQFDTTHVVMFDAGISHFFQSYMATFTVNFAPSQGKIAQGYSLSLRKYFQGGADNWVQLAVGTGIYPNNPVYYINDPTYLPGQMLNAYNVLLAARYHFAPQWIGQIYTGLTFEEYKTNQVRRNVTLTIELIYLFNKL